MKAATILACLLGSAGSVLGWSSSSPRCEKCSTQTSYVGFGSTHYRTVTIPEFSSQSGNWEMYLRVDLAHTYLGDLTMALKQDSGSTMTVWNRECSSNDLGAIFYDSATSTVSDQGKCGNSRSDIVYARPYQYFSSASIGDTPTGTYYFTLRDHYVVGQDRLYGGFGWSNGTPSDEVGCSFESEPQETPEIVANSSSCEICTDESNSFRKKDTVKYQFNVTDFESHASNTYFYVSVDIDHSYVGSLEMKLKDEDSGNEVYLWDQECDSGNNLNVYFSDAFNGTVADMGRCYREGYRVYAEPFESLGSIGESADGSYTFTLEEKNNRDGGTINRVCLGWYDEVGCSVNGTIASQLPEYISSDSPRCEICDNTRRYFKDGGGIDRLFTVTDFESQSGVNEFFVSVQVDHNRLGELEMSIEDSTNASSVYLWNNECGVASHLNVTLSDVFNDTVSEQGRCNSGLNIPLFAHPNQSLGQIALNQIGQYWFSLADRFSYPLPYPYSGYLNRVCVGWYDLDGCTVSGTVSSLADIPKCEICINDRTYVPSYGTISRMFEINTFESESGESDFFVSVQLDHHSINELEVMIRDEDTGVQRYLWYHECDTWDDLNATFSDRFSKTVSDQRGCRAGPSTQLFAKPFESLGNIAADKLSVYNFTLRSTTSTAGYLNRICIGWFDLEGCSVNAESESPQKCEICDSERKSFSPDRSLSTTFDVNSFQSDSGQSSFFVSVNLEYSDLSLLNLTVWDEMDEDAVYGSSFFYQDCQGYSDLNATFSNTFQLFVEEQGGCSAGLNTEVFARPKYRFGQNVGNQTSGGFSVSVSLDDDADEGGYLNEVCIGWYTSSKEDGCEISGSVISNSVESDDDDSDDYEEKTDRSEDGDLSIILISVGCLIIGCLMCVALCCHIRSVKAKKDWNRRKIESVTHAAVASLETMDVTPGMSEETAKAETDPTTAKMAAVASVSVDSEVEMQPGMITQQSFRAEGVPSAGSDAATPVYDEMMHNNTVEKVGESDQPVDLDAPPPAFGEW